MNERLFDGASRYYAQNRPAYPPALVEKLYDELNLSELANVMDLGCGPVSLSLALAPGVQRVVGVDPNAEMLEQARAVIGAAKATNIELVNAHAEEFVEHQRSGSFDGTVIGRAFHWMDRPRLLASLSEVLTDKGGVALATDGGLGGMRGSQLIPGTWRGLVAEMVTRHLGPTRLTAGNQLAESADFDRCFRESEFSFVETFTFTETGAWTFKQLIGYLNSTSYARPDRWQGNQPRFESELLEALQPYMQNGELPYEEEFELIVAKRQNG